MNFIERNEINRESLYQKKETWKRNVRLTRDRFKRSSNERCGNNAHVHLYHAIESSRLSAADIKRVLYENN